MKSLDDALALRGEIFGAFELAEAEADDAARRRLMTFVVVGGGPTGVEISGQLKELSRRALRRNYRRINPQDTRVVLVEGTDHLLGSMGARVARLTARKLTRMGVELHLGAMVSGMDDDGVEITKADGGHERIPAATKIWAAGTRASGLGETLAEEAGVELDKAGRVRVDARLLAAGASRGVRRRRPDGPRRPARGGRGGDAVGRPCRPHDRAAARGQGAKEFRYRDLGTLAVISRFTAVAHIGPVQVGGFIGWLLWLVVHVTFLTGFKNRFGALARWAVSFVGHGRYERALTGRWVARTRRSGPAATDPA